MPNAPRPHRDSPLARNLRALIDHQFDGSVKAWADHAQMNQSTVNRIVNGSTDATIAMLDRIAESTRYAPWQLLQDDFDPRTAPPVMDKRAMRVAAIYSSITSEQDRRRLEAIIEQFSAD